MTDTAPVVKQKYTWKFLPKDSFLANLADIVIDESRARKDFSHVEQIAESYDDVGLIQPIVLKTMPDRPGKYELIAGESRLRAAIRKEAIDIPAVFREGMTRYQVKSMELIENSKRANITWQEHNETIRQLDELKRAEYGQGGPGQKDGWNATKTGAVFGISQQAASVAINLAKTMKDNPEIALMVKNLPQTAALRKIKQIEVTAEATRKISEGIIKLHQDLRLGDALEEIKSIADASIDGTITDPPFGLNAIEEDLGDTRGGAQTYTALITDSDNLDVDRANELILTLAPELYRVMKPGAYLYMFCSMTVFQTWSGYLRDAGFCIDDQPVIWYKTRATSRFRGYSHASSYEPIIFGYKPTDTESRKPDKQLRDTKLINVISAVPISSLKKTHPFEKPASLIAQLIQNISDKGDTILDTFAGSAKTLAVCELLERSGVSFEINKDNWSRAIMQLQTKTYEGGVGEMLKAIIAKK